ncbi:PREDICTED: zonadhesin [Condylura cristata]|uniref:zonadhesin n=1 Tax=Condylura cristata TaxID=143302 RepID=UPI000643BE85|nr:PREDICTED: zonadhesin [Condylura cristata]
MIDMTSFLLSPFSKSTPRKEKPPDWKRVVRSSRDSSIITQCDFEDDSKPLCDWTQESTDDGDWTRVSGPSPNGSTGPPGGYPNGEGYYLNMDSSAFQPGGVARLRSGPIWEKGPLCVHFVYHMFGLSWGAQLKLLLLMGPKSTLLWKHLNTQSPSWMPTAVTVPKGHILPSRLVFEGVRGHTAYLDIALDSISIHRGSCHQLCTMQACNFDTPNDLCGWSWVPTASGAKWIQKNGSSGVPNVGPQDDFSSPGNGFYMLLDPKNAKPNQKSVLLSPLSQSSGCLSLSFHYVLRGQSPGGALIIYASVLGNIRKHTLFSGQPAPNWQPVSVNYTGQGQIQFTMVGVFGETPEPAVAVDAVSIAPCGESFPQCDFEDDAHPFCDWTQTLGHGGQWVRRSKNMLTQGIGTIGVPLNTVGHFIYLEADKSSQAGQSFRLVSRPFCAPDTLCVELTYHMYGFGSGSGLKLLLDGPAGSSPTSLWHRIGSQSHDWLNTSITIPEGHQQPMQLVLEATRGSNTAFVIAVGFILVNNGACRGPMPAELPSQSPVSIPGPSEIPKPTFKEKPTIFTEKPTIPTEKLSVSTEKPTVPTEKPIVPSEKPTSTKKPTIHTEKPISTEKPTIPTEKLTVLTEKPTVPTEKPTASTEKPTSTKKPTIPTEKPTSTEKLTTPTETPTVPTEKPTISTEKPTSTKKPTIRTEKTIFTEKPTIPTEKLTVLTEKPTVPTEKPTGTTTLVTPSKAPSTSLTTVMLATTTPRSTPVSCPSNAHYEHCACPASCNNPKPKCWHRCQPGCVCNSGFLFSNSTCVKASSCYCFYNNHYYKVGEMWYSPNCAEHCRCLPGSQKECRVSQCRKHTACQKKNGQYGCHPYGSATCFVYGDPHYLTFDGRPFSFMGKCTYILAQPCGSSTEPFFRVTAKNEERVQEGMSCLKAVYVTVQETTITLLKGRRTLVEGQQATLPILLKRGIYLTVSGRFVELQATFGLRIRWDGDQQLFITVPSTYSSKLCGFCGNYDGDSRNDNRKPDGTPAQDQEELGNSWQIVDNEDKECQRNQETTPSCDSSLLNSLSGPEFCGQLVAAHGAFEACLPHIMTFPFFDNCMFDMCNFQGLQQMLCSHLSALTETCQEAGYTVKPWRGPLFCPLTCPPNSKYTLCASLCPNTCRPKFSGMSCQQRCVEGCECNPGYVLSGLECVPRSQCGCLHPTDGYFKAGEKWYKPGCRYLCVCEKNFNIRCLPWKCQAQEVCSRQNGIYGCHAQSSATCTISGDPHYLTFDGAPFHFMGTCTYTLTRPCQTIPLENDFIVFATNEFRGGNPEVTYVQAVHVHVFNLKISLLKGHKVMLNGVRVTLPVWPAQGRLVIRPSGSFILLHADFGLQVRYDGDHLVEVTVSSSYAGRLCGLCGNYNNNSLDDNLQPDKKPANSAITLGAAWKSKDLSENYCYTTGINIQPPKCLKKEETDPWNKNCDILMNPRGPFSQCHRAVSPKASLSNCKYDQCRSQGSTQALCRSLQTYAAQCALAGHPPAWRNSTFCSLRCPSGSTYRPCASPCPATCLSLNAPRDCPAALPCAEGCECQKGHVLSGTSCVPLSQCGCTDQWGSYHPVGENWYTDRTCSRLCTCSTYNNISCQRSSCKHQHLCWPMEGRIRCLKTGSVTCSLSDEPYYVSFDGSHHGLGGNCTYTLVKTCHFHQRMTFFKITSRNGKSDRPAAPFSPSQVDMYIYHTWITLKRAHHVLINGTQVKLPVHNRIPNVDISANGNYTVINTVLGIKVEFDGRHLQVVIPTNYHNHVCGLCGNFNAEEEDELMMSNDELALNDTEFVDSWLDEETDQNCQQRKNQAEEKEKPEINCRQADLSRVQKQCQAALQAPAWANCATRVGLEPFLLGCTHHLCEFGGLHHALCEFLKGFEAACQAQGLKPPIWRNSSFCPLDCPTHSSYTTCLPSCLPSCWDPEGQCNGVQTARTCQEGCLCRPGFVLSEKQCVSRSQCGCKDARLGSIAAGKTWLTSRCTQSCVCTAGAIQCQPFTCPAGSHCQAKTAGRETCEPYESAQCSVFGDPHYFTFDGFSYRFQGRMTYTLVKTVDVLPEGLEPLVVEGRNKVNLPWTPVLLHEVTVKIYGYIIQLQAKLQLVVNNQRVGIPYKPSKHLGVIVRGHRLYLTTDFELAVSFDGMNNAVISLPGTYEGLVRGLCGNFDKNMTNEFIMPNGALTQNINIFGNSWEVKKNQKELARFSRAIREEEKEKAEESGYLASGCSVEQLALINRTQGCRVLVDPQGPFAACHQKVPPEPFQEHCIFDLCSTWDPRERQELSCQVLSGYAIICQEAGITLASWRDHMHCALACPANTVYQSCMTPCPASCANLVAPGGCQGPCVEGCASLPGYIYSGVQSLPRARCGCTNNGIYYQQGDSFVTEDCSQRCTCVSSEVLLCEPLSCNVGEICTLGNLTRGCFRESPCLENPCQNDGQCREQGDHFICECELGYGGDLCMEPRDLPPTANPERSSLVTVLLGMLVPAVVMVLAVVRECDKRLRRVPREKMKSKNRNRLVDSAKVGYRGLQKRAVKAFGDRDEIKVQKCRRGKSLGRGSCIGPNLTTGGNQAAQTKLAQPSPGGCPRGLVEHGKLKMAKRATKADSPIASKPVPAVNIWSTSVFFWTGPPAQLIRLPLSGDYKAVL